MRVYTRGENRAEMRVKVSVVIDKEVYEKSHSLGINVSKACENYLRTLNNAIDATNGQNTPLLPQVLSGEKLECGCRDLNPGRQRGRLMS